MSIGSDITQANLATTGGIRYKLLNGYPTFDVSDDGTKSVEEIAIRSVDFAGFVVESMPPPIFFLNFVVLPPRRRMPGTTFMVTKSISAAPFAGSMPGDPLNAHGNGASYDDWYRLTINYETMQESDDRKREPNRPETFLEHSLSAGGEFLSIPPNRTEIQEGDVDTETSIGEIEANQDQQMPIVKVIPTIEHNFKWKYVLEPNWAEIYKMLGTVNDRALAWIPESKKDTVMFTGVSGNQVYTWDGAQARVQPWSLDFKFSQKHIQEDEAVYGWNHAFSPKKGKWVKLFRADAQPLYQRRDFRPMFRTARPNPNARV